MEGKREKYALITGSASGMGRCYAEALAGRGYAVLAVDRDEAANRTLCEALQRTYGVSAEAMTLDLAAPNAVERLLSLVGTRQTELEVLICNAGMLAFGGFAALETARIEQLMMLHMTTHTHLVHRIGQQMRRQGRGYILWVSSATARMPYPSIALYAATKAYVRSMAVALHDEWAQDGVVVTALCPGAVDTPFYALDEGLRRALLRFGVLLSPEEVVRRALRALFRGRRCITLGWAAKMMVGCGRLIPAWVIRRVVATQRVKRLLA